MKLMYRFVPLTLLTVLEEWFAICSTCVNWNSVYSYRFKLAACVRQGDVLSPILFVIYNNFIKNLFITKSNERKSDTVRGHTSKPYNSSGKHLLLIVFKVTSSEAVLPIFPKTALAVR